MEYTINKTIDLIAKKFNLHYEDVVRAFVDECKKHVADEQHISADDVSVDVLENDIYLLYNNQRININNISISLFTKIKKCTSLALKQMVITLKNNEISQLVNQIIVAIIIKVDRYGVIAKYMDYHFYVYNKNFIPSDVIAINYKYKFLVVKSDVAMTGLRFTLLRNCESFIQAIIAANIPEIRDDRVSIVNHYRITGVKNFVHVLSKTQDNAVALCVGYRGMRLKSIMKDIGGEKIAFVDSNYYTLSCVSFICLGKTFCSEVIYVLHDNARIINTNIKVTTDAVTVIIYVSKYSVLTKLCRNNKAVEFIRNVYNVIVEAISIDKIDGYRLFMQHALCVHDEHIVADLYELLPTVYHFYHFEPHILVSRGYEDICRKILSLMLVNIHVLNNEYNIDYILSKNITVYQYKINRYNEDSKN